MCRFFHRKKKTEPVIPPEVSGTERLLRFVLSPLHFKKNGELKSNVFNPTVDSDEISVTRLDYTTIEECKRLAHKMDRDEPARAYRGFCLLNKDIAIACGAKDVVGSPKEDNPAHADIIVDEVRAEGALPAKLQLVADELRDKSVFLKDPNPQSEGWSGVALTLTDE